MLDEKTRLGKLGEQVKDTATDATIVPLEMTSSALKAASGITSELGEGSVHIARAGKEGTAALEETVAAAHESSRLLKSLIQKGANKAHISSGMTAVRESSRRGIASTRGERRQINEELKTKLARHKADVAEAEAEAEAAAKKERKLDLIKLRREKNKAKTNRERGRLAEKEERKNKKREKLKREIELLKTEKEQLEEEVKKILEMKNDPEIVNPDKEGGGKKRKSKRRKKRRKSYRRRKSSKRRKKTRRK